MNTKPFGEIAIGTKFRMPWTAQYSIPLSESILEKIKDRADFHNAKYVKSTLTDATFAYLPNSAPIEVIE
jgi:hypothetical protein